MDLIQSFYAHSAEGLPENEWQSLQDHLVSVAELAAGKACHFNGQELASVAGLLHDIGKYTREFQQRLHGSSQKVDHSTHGACIARERFKANPIIGMLLAYTIAGHHAGLADARETTSKQTITDLHRRLKSTNLPVLDAVWTQEIQLPDCISLSLPSAPGQQSLSEIAFRLSILGRMIYSCLVDADFLDTEAFYNRIDGKQGRDDSFPSICQLQSELNRYLNQPKFQSTDGINKTRKSILATVRDRAALEPGLFSLNVPTGGGKTLASLAFALDHAVKYGLRRVILVIPFTSIVEQNAAVWREALGVYGEQAVLEHHSAYSADKQSYENPGSKDKLRQAAENWEAPVVVTTAVQFFESLFANRSSRCRKLHNIANSVVILDEAQTLPTQLLRPCVAMISELALTYRSSLVLCTATQPALERKDGFEKGLENVRELAPSPVDLHRILERVKIEYIGELSDDDLIEALLDQHQVLCIVNNRRHARALFEQIRQSEGSAHLTTLMCAEHRTVQLNEIRKRLIADQPVRLISTSLIEAGVDVDFPAVYRAETGLDSIAQAAGRCNREGKRDLEQSKVRVFKPEAIWPLPPEVKRFAGAFQTVYRKYPENLLSLDAIKAYFAEVYWLEDKALDAHNILGCANLAGAELDIGYDQMAQRFRMIESNMMPVIVPYEGEAEQAGKAEIYGLIDALEYAEQVGGIARQLQRYLVQVPEQGVKALMEFGAVRAIQPERFGYQFLLLQNDSLYDKVCGLSWDNTTFVRSEDTVM